MLAEMSHKGGADAQVAERAGNDLERWLLGLNEGTRQYSSFPFCATGSRKRHSQVSALDLPRDRAG